MPNALRQIYLLCYKEMRVNSHSILYLYTHFSQKNLLNVIFQVSHWNLH
jgi:hypothetical protein